ncbi:hypothetical protein Zmor_003331 [Zophobas morio]|uniref:Vitellogenin domain-containing protein n=1 Tax=Zophobas morio TaxID=2755281 RepID=A0AA38HP52_9CUCU|nr:hypothetical protein Zmor_003331 [Zophobas morio]
MKLFFRLTLAFLLATTSFAQHNPLKDPNVCGRPICKGTGKFKYGPGTQQNYKYSVNVRSFFNGTSKNESSLHVEGTVTLNFLTPCDGLLTLSDLKLSENPSEDGQETLPHANSQEFSDMISEFSLRFAFNDGIISEICPNEEEKNWVLNFKRGILSLLHNTMKRFDLDHSTTEEDVRGQCPTLYYVQGAKETSLILHKTKDLNACENRAKLNSMVQSVPYNFRPELQEGKNLLKSSSRCEMSIDHNIYNEITCEETHVLQPFSNQDAGATTIVVQRLILQGENVETLGEQLEISRRTSLLFDHVPSPKRTHGELRASRDLIKKMCKQSTDDVQIEFSDLFTKFIQTLRLLSYPSLSILYRHASTTCPTGKKHMLDALPYVNTAGSVGLMTDIMSKGGVPENIAKEWMMSIAFISRPDENMMRAVAELLQKKPFDVNVAFSVTALTHTYCSAHSDCIQNESVGTILNHIENLIVSVYRWKPFNRESQDKIIVALKSLGNIGVVTDSIKRYLVSIIEDSQIDAAIRVAAVEAYRRLPCTESRDYFESLFRNQDENVEVRIASYLQIMRCPNYLMIRTVKHSLENEDVNQVGSFVWSHLNNLMKSSIPSRVEIQGLLSDLNLVKKFSSDVRKFSHHREGSVFFEEYNVGANYDGNVIFSPSSYVPKTAMLNLTVDLFGQSINLMEVYGRLEGFEHYLESMFGPKGPLNSEKLKEKISKVRFSRSASENEVLKSEIDRLPNVMENSSGEPKVSLGLKVFGNELKYATFDGDEEIKAALRTLNPVDHLKRILSGKEINYNKAAMFLDSNYVVPSGAGLPISLNALGTASINLKLFGSLHAPNFIETKELDLKVDIRPSISLDLTGVMSVDAFYATTGIKLKSSMYTSSAIEGDIKIRGFKLVNVKFSIPRQTSEIFGAKYELIVMKRNVEQLQSGLSKHRVSKSICSWPAVDKTVGLKLCGEYHFINVTKINKAPYFVLAGPSGFRLFLEKSDPTAKIYLFEYKWTDKKDLSVVSLTFDTPGSSVGRLFSANFTVDRQSQNLTLFLQSTAGTVLARGKYKNTDSEKYLQLVLTINDKKHFDLELSLIRRDSRHGFIYRPKIYLGINGERVLELQGTLKLVSKRGTSQYDVDLKFQTKRLSSKLFGYISKTEASVAANLKLDYKFAKTKEQRVMFAFSLADRSPKNLVDIRGTCSLFSTSYPNFNFDANFKLQKGGGHVESKFDLTSCPLEKNHPEAELHKLKLEWLFSYKSLLDSTRTFNTILSVSKQSTGLNLKGEFTVEVKNPNVDVLMVIKYGNDKEVSVAVFWSHPRTQLEHMEGRINITVPSFTPMILEGKLQEKVASQYIVDVRGTWFSGHNASASGIYQVKTTPNSSNRQLKLILRSPAFKDITLNLQFNRDNDKLEIDFKADHDTNNYCLYLKHTVVSPQETTTQVELKYKAQRYSMLSSVYFGDHRRVSLEFHIDQLRDIHFAVWEHNKETYKAAGLELKWDANRDNNQKLVVSGNFTKLASFNYKGNLLISYPGRTILANFDFLLESGHFNTLVRLSWADQQSFAVKLQVDYNTDRQTYIVINSQIVTPFDGWQKTTINGGYHHNRNMYRINGSIYWKHDENVTLDLFEDYSISDAAFECKLKTSLTSTLKHIPTLSAYVSHNQDTSKLDTTLRLMYSPEHVIDIQSNWKVEKNHNYTNLLMGAVTATTPFDACRRSHLISKMYYTKTKHLRGVATLDLDHKKFTASFEGNLRKLTNSMFVCNVTTPIEKYKTMVGRFGLSEERRHLVAQIAYPSGTLGVEILLEMEDITNFDVKLSLGTPISFLREIFVVGKLKPHEADFRARWNSFMLGFTGVWRYVNVIDFEYSYKIYTPIEGFEENGIVSKLIFKEGLDFEVSIKLSQYKLGVAVLCIPKPKLLKEMGIRTHDIYGRMLEGRSWSEHKNEEDQEEDEEEEDSLNWTGSIKIDAIIYPTMEGTLDIDQEGPVYILDATLSLPAGNATVNDVFEFIDVMTMKNDLRITTPYDTFKFITSSYNLQIIPGHKYDLGLGLDYQNRTRWIRTGVLASYAINVGEAEEERYNTTLQIYTPLENLPQLLVRATHETETNIYRTNLSVTTNSSDISVTTKAEVFNGLFNAAVSLEAITPTFEIPPTDIVFTKKTVQDDHSIETRIKIERVLKNEVCFKANWMYKSLNHFYAITALETPYQGMENSQTGIKVHVTEKEMDSWSLVKVHPLEIEVNSTFRTNVFRATSNINFNGKKFPITLSAHVSQSSPKSKSIYGNLYLKNKEFRINGHANMLGKVPVDAQIKLTPQDGSDPLNFEYKLEGKEDGSYILTGSAQHSDKFTRFEANLMTRHKLNWQLDLQVDTSHQVYNKFAVQANATSTRAGTSISIAARTPIPKLENPKLGASVVASGQQRNGRAYFEVAESKGDIQVDWVLLFLENMCVKAVGNYQNRQYKSQSRVEGFYINPNQSFEFIKAGGDVNVDTLWSAGSNVTLSLPNYQNMNLEAHVKPPSPIKEVYSLAGKLRYDKDLRTVEYLGKYSTANSKKTYGSWGNVSLADKTRMGGNVELEWNNKRINNYLDLWRSQNTWNVVYKLRTPKFDDKETLVTEMSYRSSDAYHNITCEAFYPENRSFAFARVDYKGLDNMNGTLNVTIPFRNVSYVGARFNTKTNARLYNRHLEVSWPNDNAILDCQCVRETQRSVLKSNTTGVLVIEVPLTTRHIANIQFNYEERPRLSTGHATVDYNGNKVLEGKYNCQSESRAGFDKDRIHVEVQNKLVPVGADYVHGYEYGAPRDGSNAPTVDTKHLHLYHLKNLTKFNITGEMSVRTSSTGRQIAFSATHSNRTVKLWTGYHVLEQQFKQHSRLELSPSTWIEYHLDLFNRTVSEAFESQQVQIDVAYPRRNFTAKGVYNISDLSMSTDVSLTWDKDKKTLQAGLDWKRAALHRDEILLEIKHPSFQKDVTFFGEYESDDKKLLDTQLTVDYSVNPSQRLVVGARVDDSSRPSTIYNYTYKVWALHDATNLNLNTHGGFYWNPYGYSTGHYTDYKRSYLPLQTAEALARVDLTRNELELKKKAGQELSYLWTRYGGAFPTYTANISASHEMNNASGEFYLNFEEKLVQLDFNMTTDGSQSLHVYGVIPDARSAMFDIWRDYEDIRVSDVAYYVRLNHSRLIMSSLLWRPDLKQDIQNGIRSAVKQLYSDVLEGINNTKQYVRAETTDALRGIWDDAKPSIDLFLQDLKHLRVIEQDFEEFKTFLNRSYYANEFYIRDIVNISMLMFDELALKSHFESLPAIVSEVWQIMGSSGSKIKTSILWVIEKIKTYYKNTVDFIHGLVDGDPIEHLSDAFKNIVEQYDAFVKDLHVAFIQYMERLWAQTYALIVSNWYKTLAAVEPTFIKLVHYLESIVWNTGRDFLDFLYIRKSEIIESPYFAKFTNFTHDMDKFYKDITGNNTIASIVKYTKIAWNFLKEKYLNTVPFGKELQEVVLEIVAEINELRNLPSFQYLEMKYDELYANAKWLSDYFDMEVRLQRFMALLRQKLMDMSQTALEAENRYRVAKTKFIFEPSDGIMLLEQKLPMSWHAFNETPKFQEIPEFQTVYTIQKYLTSARISFWDFYYDYKPYTELSGWLPPFKAQALLVGSRYYVTFDRRYYDFRGSCSYLLATDYVDRNFSVVVSYDNNAKTHELLLLINNTVVHVNVFANTVKVGDNGISLPAQIDDTFLYLENDIFTAVSQTGFTLECNMKFDLCVFEVAGWYFGKTAGLWGTINNEPSDDFLTSQKVKAKPTDLRLFTDSWALNNCTSNLNNHVGTRPNRRIESLCKEFFLSKLSSLTTCFAKVPKDPFLKMCLNYTTEKEACSAALAYISVCSYSNTPLRIPDVCVKCSAPNGTLLDEGEFIQLNPPDLPQSADVVFIVEAKACNKDLRARKNMDSVIEALHKELTEQRLKNNRYSVVLFGGNGVYDEPRSLVVHNRVFADWQQIVPYFDSIPAGDGNSDIFGAITFAMELLFRPGVSKNFVLIPCSECKDYNMKLDYAIVHQLLLESDVTLHILMNEEFSLPKMRDNKIPFGIGATTAYTKKDIRGLIGDAALRKQVSLPKSTLGYCAPLALETNGTIFCGKNLESDKKGNVKKFATVFAKRVAASARPTRCVECECSAFDNGVSSMDCYSCTYPTRSNIDYMFDEDLAFMTMQPGDDLPSMEAR